MGQSKRSVTQFLALAAFAAILAAGASWLRRGAAVLESDFQVSQRQPAGPSAEQPIRPVPLDDVAAWRDHLHAGGTVRLLPHNSKAGDDQGMAILGLGSLEGDDLAFAEATLRDIVERQTKALVETFGVAESSPRSPEETALEVATQQRRLHGYEAYARGLQLGQYYVVAGHGDAPPLPEGYMALNVPVPHRGLCVITIRKSDFGLDEIDAHVAAVRRTWLIKVAAEFNAKGDEERARAIARHDAHARSDLAWRQRTFPDGLTIDRHRMVLVLQ